MKFKLTVIGGGGDCARELDAFENHVCAMLEPLDVGSSVYRFELCLELSHRQARPDWYLAMRRYSVYRARLRSLLAVAQLDARSLETHLHEALADALIEAAQRTQQMAKLPRDFLGERFRRSVRAAAQAWPQTARLARSQ